MRKKKKKKKQKKIWKSKFNKINKKRDKIKGPRRNKTYLKKYTYH